MGIFCPVSKVNVLVTCNRVEGIEFDYDSGCFYKTYKEHPDVLPLSLMMRKRDPNHPLSCLAQRVSNHAEREIKLQSNAICLNFDKFGLVGKVENVDIRQQMVTLNINKKHEESKVHDPFLGQKVIMNLRKENNEALLKSGQFFGDQDIE